MARKRTFWKPVHGQYASYTGRTSPLLRGGKIVEVLGEASTTRTLVRAIGRAGHPVSFTVLTSNLGQPQPQLFD